MKSLDFLKEGFVEDASEAHQDHEVQMARQECFHAAEHALALHKLLRNISEAQGLEGWVSSKITLANDYLQRVREYLEYELLTKDINDEAPAMTIAEDQESKKKNLVVEYKVSGAEQGSENYTINNIELNALQKVASGYYDRPVTISQSKDNPDLYTINVAMTVGPVNYGSYNAATRTASIAKRMTDKGDQLQKVLQGISEAQSAEERAESDRQMQDFLSKGGEIQQVRANRGPRRSGASLASHHIGGMGDARTGRRSQMRGLGSNPTGKLLVAKESEGVAEDQLDEIDIDTLNQLASHAVNTMGQSGANFAAGATGGLVGGAIAGGTKKAVDWYYKQKQKKAEAERKKSQHQGVAEGSLNEGQYEMMMHNGQVKKFIAKDDADAKRIAKGHGAKSLIRLRGGVPAGKVTEQGVAEARSPEEFMRQMDAIAATPQTFKVGDWVTIDPNETSGYASSGMIGSIVELYDDEGESMAKIAVGGSSGVQTKMKTRGGVFGPPGTTIGLGKGVRSSGTHTVVPTSILQKYDPQGVAEGSDNYDINSDQMSKRYAEVALEKNPNFTVKDKDEILKIAYEYAKEHAPGFVNQIWKPEAVLKAYFYMQNRHKPQGELNPDVKLEVKQQMLKVYGPGKVTFTYHNYHNYAQHEGKFGNTNSNEFDPKTGKVKFDGGSVSSSYYGEGVAEGKKPDRYHIVGKDGKPVNLASYADRASAIKDRDEKYPGAVVQQVGPRGKVKGMAEGSVTPDVSVKKLAYPYDDPSIEEWHLYRGKEIIGFIIKNLPGTAEGLYVAAGHGPGRAFTEDFTSLKSAVKFIASLDNQGVAEGLPGSLSKSDYTSGKTVKHTSSNCTTCHGRKIMYKLDGKLFADNKQSATKIKCPTCKGTGDKQGVAEGFPHDVDHMPGKTIKHQSTNCTTCHGRKTMYKLDGKLFADNKKGATPVKCPTCKGTGDKQGVAEGAKCNHTMEGTNCPVHGLKECGSYGKVEEMSAGSVATRVNPTAKNKSKVGTLFGGTYKQKKIKEAKQMTFPGENTKPPQRSGDQVRGTEKATKPNPFKHRLVGNE